MGREHLLFRHLRYRQFASFHTHLGWPAFPTSDYYEGSATRPTLAEGWPSVAGEPDELPKFAWLRLRAVLVLPLRLARLVAALAIGGCRWEYGSPALPRLSLLPGGRDSDDSTLALP